MKKYLFILLGLVLFSCKKDDEDNANSEASLYGEWSRLSTKIEYFDNQGYKLIDEVDEGYVQSIIFKDDKTYLSENHDYLFSPADDELIQGVWELSDDGSTIVFEKGLGTFNGESESAIKILKLTDDRMVIETYLSMNHQDLAYSSDAIYLADSRLFMMEFELESENSYSIGLEDGRLARYAKSYYDLYELDDRTTDDLRSAEPFMINYYYSLSFADSTITAEATQDPYYLNTDYYLGFRDGFDNGINQDFLAASFYNRMASNRDQKLLCTMVFERIR